MDLADKKIQVIPELKAETPPSMNDGGPSKRSGPPSSRRPLSGKAKLRGRACLFRASRPRGHTCSPTCNHASARPNGGVPSKIPMSILAESMAHIVRDMHAYAHRPPQQRREEVKTKNKICRPMNAFMMYRCAYTQLAKLLINQTKFQVLNVAIGDSWRVEAEEVKTYYQHLANIEKDNHQRTFPEYKFTPNRGPAVANISVPASPPWTANSSCEDFSYPAWVVSNTGCCSSPLDPDYNTRSNTRTMSQDLGPNGSIPPTFNSHPGSVSSYSEIKLSHLPGGISDIEDLHPHCSVIPTPTFLYGISDDLIGLPGGACYDPLQPQPRSPFRGCVNPEGSLNSQMLSYDANSGVPMNLARAYPGVPNHYPVWE